MSFLSCLASLAKFLKGYYDEEELQLLKLVEKLTQTKTVEHVFS